jgi:hypothetical protein
VGWVLFRAGFGPGPGIRGNSGVEGLTGYPQGLGGQGGYHRAVSRAQRGAASLVFCRGAGTISGQGRGSLQGVGGTAVEGRPGQALRLLDDVGELVSQQPIAVGSARTERTGM